MTDMGYLPFALVASLVVAATAHRRLYASAQPLRRELAEKGERLLASPSLPESERAMVRMLLNTAFGGGWLMLNSIVLFWVVAIGVVIRPSIITQAMAGLNSATPEVQRLHREVLDLHDRILLANHPTLWMVLHAEIMLTLPMAIIAASLIRGYMPKIGDRFLILSMLESREAAFWGRRAAV